jgi:hypothetical protein
VSPVPNYATGKYLVELLGNQGFSETSNGNPQFFMKFKVVAIFDHSTGEWQMVDESERTWYRVLTANSAQYAAEDFRALGFAGDKFSQLDPRHPQKHIFTGQIEMTCTIDHYNGKPKEKWNVVRADSSGWEEKVVESSKLKQLDMLFGKALAAAPAAAVQQAKPVAARPAPLASQPRSSQSINPATAYSSASVADTNEITDDDLPF